MFFRTTLATLALSASLPAFAGDVPNQTTSYGSAVTATRLDQMEGQLADLQAKQAADQAASDKAIKSLSWRIKQLKDAGATPAQIAADPTVVDLSATILAMADTVNATADLAVTLQNAISGKASQADLDALTARVWTLESTPPQVVHDTNTVIHTVEVKQKVEFRSGNTQEAIRLLQNAFHARPDAEIAAHLGEVLWSVGQKEQASAIWKEGIGLNPQNETLRETMRRLSGSP